MIEQTYRNKILWFFLAIFIVSIFLLGWLLKPFVATIVLAAVVTGVFTPVYRLIRKQCNQSVSSLITCLLIFIVLFIPIISFCGILTKEAADLYRMGKEAVISGQIKTLLETTQAVDKTNLFLSNLGTDLSFEDLNETITKAGEAVGRFLFEQASSITKNVFRFIVNFFFMLIIIYYLLIDGRRLLCFISDLSPLPQEQDEKLLKKFKDMAGAILIGNGLGGLIQGFAGGVVFWLFGLNSPFLWGVIMGLLAFLPIIGIGVVFIPTSIYLFLKGRVAAGLFFIIFYCILSFGTEYLFKPKLVGERVKMHTLLVFLAIIGGLKLFGILGII